ncbi:hypothetical protein QAD02_011958 [Eretmocerus hayati]|uniref:Uncharacterized protein n=1 Tax=Eretmocerus hayati TaxID=131215 RepID=A0ACC2NYH4_9HYME|nr:hypothetical protein QAD02_011958 [Eretmocerus hayati]
MIVAAQVQLLFITKRPIENSIKHWRPARLKGISSVNNLPFAEASCAAPLLNGCIAMNIAVSTRPGVHAAIFIVMRMLACAKAGRFVRPFMALCKFLEFSETVHIYLIMDHLYHDNLDTLALPGLFGNEMSAMHRAIAYLRSLPESQRPYAKMLDYSEKANVLQSRHFGMLTFAARHVVVIKKSSMQYYKPPREDSKLAELANSIDTYMTKKIQAGMLNAAEAMSYLTNPQTGRKSIAMCDTAVEEETEFQDAPLDDRD